MDDDAAFEALMTAFSTTIHHWPVIGRERPKWWQRQSKKTEKRINTALAIIGKGPVNENMRDNFWLQLRIGQDIREDAGGYMWRCWCAALGYPYIEPTYTYSGYIGPTFESAIRSIADFPTEN